MGIFSIFSREKKESLDKGLSKTKESVFSKISKAIIGKSKVDDEVLRCFQVFKVPYVKIGLSNVTNTIISLL